MDMFKLHRCTNQRASQPIKHRDRTGHSEIPITNPTQIWMTRLKQTDKELEPKAHLIGRRGSRSATDMSQTKYKSKGAETWTIAEQ